MEWASLSSLMSYCMCIFWSVPEFVSLVPFGFIQASAWACMHDCCGCWDSSLSSDCWRCVLLQCLWTLHCGFLGLLSLGAMQPGSPFWPPWQALAFWRVSFLTLPLLSFSCWGTLNQPMGGILVTGRCSDEEFHLQVSLALLVLGRWTWKLHHGFEQHDPHGTRFW